MRNKILFILLFFGLFLPLNVFAAELPREGVTYFFTYPNGYETASTNYEDAINPPEELIYSTTTDENGHVFLNGWNDEGELRIIEKVPNGYSIENREVTIDLANHESAEFININQSLINPKTGKSILLIIEILVVLGGFYLFAFKRKKSGLFVLILIAFVLYIANARAAQDSFVIIVKDNDGKGLSDVKVEIYAKPIVEAYPAVKLITEEVPFYDGTYEMYVRLPEDGCSFDDMLNFNYDQYYDSYINMFSPVKNGYSFVYDYIESMHNGDEYIGNLQRTEDYFEYSTLDFNGAILNFRGLELTSVPFTYYNPEIFRSLLNRFKYNQLYLVGLDTHQNCRRYDSNGILKGSIIEDIDDGRTYYMCWNNKPDGIYVNGIPYVGNFDSCFEQSYLVGVCGYEYEFFNRLYGSKVKIIHYSSDYSMHLVLDNFYDQSPLFDELTSFEIIENGEVILSIDQNDFEFDDSNNFYTITNNSKSNSLLNYFRQFNDTCIPCK